jgi:V8-like Glu-specific endopeptidase
MVTPLESQIVEHTYNSQIQFRSQSRNHPQSGDTLSMPGQRGQKTWEKQRLYMYTQNPQAFQEERILIKNSPAKDARTKVENTRDPLYSFHAQITAKFRNKIYGGSGALVGPHHLLTCAHNVYKNKKKMWATDITVYPALNGKQEPFGEVKVTKIYTFTQYTQNKDSSYDLALLILEKSVGKYTGWAGLLAAPDNTLFQQEINLYGYPGDKNFTEMWGMKHKIKQIHPEQFEYLIDTYGGQSGSPIWIDQFGLPLIVGVHTAGGIDSNFGVRISKEKFIVLVAKIEETYKRQKIVVAKRQKTQASHAKSEVTKKPRPKPILPAPIMAVPPNAFGKAKWTQYFGDIGVEPPLPPNIHDILNAPCPFWPDNRVGETHLLVLIPRTVKGKPFNINSFLELIQKPSGGGHPTTYSGYWDEIKKEYESKKSNKISNALIVN